MIDGVDMFCDYCQAVRNVSSVRFERDEIRVSCDVCFHYKHYEIKKKEFDSLGRKID